MQSENRLKLIPSYAAKLLAVLLLTSLSRDVFAADIVIGNEYFEYAISAQGKNLRFADKSTGANYIDARSASYCASVVSAGKEYSVSAASLEGTALKLQFGKAGVTAEIQVVLGQDRITMMVKSVTGPADSFIFVDVPLRTEGLPSDSFAGCALAMNLHTRVFQLPALQTHLKAACYKRFGFIGAEVTLLGLPQAKILPVIRKVMEQAKDIPPSTTGGAWAQQAKEGYGSYLMNFGTLTSETVEEWVGMCNNLHFTQVDNHGGSFFRFGDFELDKKQWPNGWADFKNVNKRLHDAGISSIFHTYAFFIDKNARYVTPVPSEDLGYFRTFTLAKPIGAEDSVIAVEESTADLSLTTGFFVRNSRTVRIGTELVEFSGVSKTPPFALTGCKRGSLKTSASAHKANEKAYHLREMFGRFVPDPESALFSEIARRTAEIVNQADFDGIYLDAIDGSDILAGTENFWYYGGKFVLEIAKHLKRSVGMEMSSMIHMWWHYRSRWQAWDRPVRGYKRFIDIHTASIKSEEYEHGLWTGNTPMINKLAPAENGPLLLPLQLGWWAHQTWNPPQIEPTFSDDIEYLGCKMIGNNAGLAMIGGADEKTLTEFPAFRRLNGIIRQYEELRTQRYFNDTIRGLLRQPGKDFTLFMNKDNIWTFKPVFYKKHKIAGLSHPSAKWKVTNEFASQPVQLRIEPLMSQQSYHDTANKTLADLSVVNTLQQKETAKGVSGSMSASGEKTPDGDAAFVYTARNDGAPREASWINIEREFTPALKLGQRQALGVWIKGDGNGQLLSLRIESPKEVSSGARGDHFIRIDFKGWKYFELVEIESADFSDYLWPVPQSTADFYVYDSYRHTVVFDQVNKLQFWYNNLPAGKSASTIIGPVKAVTLVSQSVVDPAIEIGGRKIVFPVTMEPGTYLEYKSFDNCKLYGSKGEFLRDINPKGPAPLLAAGSNNVSFSANRSGSAQQRVQVTVIGEGEALK